MSVVKWTFGVAVLACCVMPAMAQNSIQTAFNYNLAEDHAAPAAPEATAEKSNCGCDQSSSSSSCCESSCGCEQSCGCENGCCGGCGCGCDCCDLGLDNYWPFCCCCDLGCPCKLKDCLTPCCCGPDYGGWVQMGYHSQNTGLSANDGDQLDTNDYPGRVQLQQSYFYVEKKAKTDSCCCDWGYRYDVVYGTNGDTVQAFGNQNNGWDKSWDHGVYGWAMPQAYVEVGYCDWSVKMGHWYTPVGYEVFAPTGNFFYSHSLSWYNSEPFTHTGALGTYTGDPCTTWYAGYSLGWDTAFDTFDGGSNFVGGFTRKLNDCLSLSYLLNVGNFGLRSDGQFGYEHTFIVDYKHCKWEYVMENDYVHTDGFNGGNGPDIEDQDFEVNNYLYYTINDCWKAGVRAEWWRSNQVTGEQTSFYELTGGLNYKPHANVIIRPEVRYDWSPTDLENQDGADYNRVIGAVDLIVTY